MLPRLARHEARGYRQQPTSEPHSRTPPPFWGTGPELGRVNRRHHNGPPKRKCHLLIPTRPNRQMPSAKCQVPSAKCHNRLPLGGSKVDLGNESRLGKRFVFSPRQFGKQSLSQNDGGTRRFNAAKRLVNDPFAPKRPCQKRFGRYPRLLFASKCPGLAGSSRRCRTDVAGARPADVGIGSGARGVHLLQGRPRLDRNQKGPP